MADLKRALCEIRREITETLDNIAYDAAEAKDEETGNGAKYTFLKMVERAEYGVKLAKISEELEELAS
jgi:hypothetical protein